MFLKKFEYMFTHLCYNLKSANIFSSEQIFIKHKIFPKQKSISINKSLCPKDNDFTSQNQGKDEKNIYRKLF